MIPTDNPILGKYTAPDRSVVITEQSEEVKAQYERIDELTTILGEARLQLEYLHEKFQPTGTSEAVLARIDAVLT
jgi:hypothetical protein